MKKIRYIVCWLLIINLIYLNVETMVGDEWRLKKNPDDYTTCSVVIEECRPYGDPYNRVAFFTYEQMSRYVPCNYWEEEGDIIEVAYDKSGNFIRTGLHFCDSWKHEWIWIIAVVVAMVYAHIKDFKKNI